MLVQLFRKDGGKVKEKAGELLGDREMERDGQLEKAPGSRARVPMLARGNVVSV